MKIDPLHEVLTASEADEIFSKARDTTRWNLNNGFLHGRKSGKTWLVTRSECMRVYQPEQYKQLQFDLGQEQDIKPRYRKTVRIRKCEVISDNGNVYESVNVGKNFHDSVNVGAHDNGNGELRLYYAPKRGFYHIVKPDGLTVRCGQKVKLDGEFKYGSLEDVTCSNCKKFYLSDKK